MQLTAHTFTSTSRHVPYLDKELTGCLIDSAWISFITRALTAPEILGQSDVVRELARIEKSRELPELRCKFQRDIDHLIDSLLSLPPKQRLLVCLQTNLTLFVLSPWIGSRWQPSNWWRRPDLTERLPSRRSNLSSNYSRECCPASRFEIILSTSRMCKVSV